jgi:hypothetical protein
MTRLHGILPFLEPLPRFEVGQPSNILRIFEKGGEKQEEIGNPDAFESPGHPARRLSERGLGTLNRIDPVYLNLQKTRLNDPLLGFMGSNDHPAITGPAAAPPATSSMPTTARRPTRAGGRSWQPGAELHRRPDDPEEREGPPDPSTSSPAASRPASA